MPYYKDRRSERTVFISDEDLAKMSHEERLGLLNLHPSPDENGGQTVIPPEGDGTEPTPDEKPAKKAPAKKATTKKAPAKKPATPKKTPAKKAPARAPKAKTSATTAAKKTPKKESK